MKKLEWCTPTAGEFGTKILKSKCGKYWIIKERKGFVDQYGNDNRWDCYQSVLFHVDGAYVVGWFRDSKSAIAACELVEVSGVSKPNVHCSDALFPLEK